MGEDSGRKREDDGAYSSEYSDEDFLAVVRELQPATTGQVAEEVGCHRSTALRRLRALADRGEIRGRSVGTTTVWAVPHE